MNATIVNATIALRIGDSWRTLAEDLTAAQIESLEESERRNVEDESDRLGDARSWVIANHGTRIYFGHLPIPDGATTVHLADNEAYEGRWARSFTGDVAMIGEEGFDSVQVQPIGVQFSDGTVEREIDFLVEGGDEPDDYSRTRITVEKARAIAKMLTDAADEIEKSNQT